MKPFPLFSDKWFDCEDVEAYNKDIPAFRPGGNLTALRANALKVKRAATEEAQKEVWEMQNVQIGKKDVKPCDHHAGHPRVKRHERVDLSIHQTPTILVLVPPRWGTAGMLTHGWTYFRVQVRRRATKLDYGLELLQVDVVVGCQTLYPGAYGGACGFACARLVVCNGRFSTSAAQDRFDGKCRP